MNAAPESPAPRTNPVHFEDELHRSNLRTAMELGWLAERPELVGWREVETGDGKGKRLESVA